MVAVAWSEVRQAWRDHVRSRVTGQPIPWGIVTRWLAVSLAVVLLFVAVACGGSASSPEPQAFTGAFTATPAPDVLPEQAFTDAANAAACEPATVARVDYTPANQAGDGLAAVLVQYYLPKDTPNMQAIAEQTTINAQQAVFYTGIRYDYCQVIVYPSRTAGQMTIFADLSYQPASTAVWSGMTPAALASICDTYKTNAPMGF